MKINDKLNKINEIIGKARLASPIAALGVILLAASKTQPVAIIEEAIAAGIIDFGENRVQEAQEKWGIGGLKAKYPHIRLHLIGALQTNKVRQALQLFDVIQSVDRIALADAIARGRDSGFGIQGKEFFIQVNTGEEPQKAGILPKDADSFVSYCVQDLKLPITGLMCIPPADQPPAPHFALLREIAMRNNLKELSMGMSGDFETAIRMGATCVRVGSGIFGSRI